MDLLGVEYVIEPRLVCGLDDYIHTVFEVSHSGLGAQDAIAGGGRFEITVPGAKKPLPGVGFAAGIERLLLVREELGIQATESSNIDIFLVSMGETALNKNIALSKELRQIGIRVAMDYELRSMKAQMRSASKSGAKFAYIVGETELEAGAGQCKNLLNSEQNNVNFDELATVIKSQI